jgi:hypothetical protein
MTDNPEQDFQDHSTRQEDQEELTQEEIDEIKDNYYHLISR